MSYTVSIHRFIRPVLLPVGAGLLLGSLDLVFACTYWNVLHHVPPARILQGIAAGLLGARAFAGGAATVWLGALLHYAIMQAMVFFYVVASRRAPLLVQRPGICGPLYGLLLYAVMTGIVLPLSAAASAPMLPGWIASSIVVHAALIGLPIAWVARFAASGNGQRPALVRAEPAA
ncbi:hypothetical protein ACPPVV_17015 [Rhodanobacter sp. Col0626]|uniref:hypothetical protein n=1 Tax=Rhodanobacter sp. Col0626 TaxID=3415679 RepID=UPI003CE857BB